MAVVRHGRWRDRIHADRTHSGQGHRLLEHHDRQGRSCGDKRAGSTGAGYQLTAITLTLVQVDTLRSLDGNHRADWFAMAAQRLIGELCDLVDEADRLVDDADAEALGEY